MPLYGDDQWWKILSTESSTAGVLFVFTAFACILVLTPYWVYQLQKFNLYKDEFAMKKRYHSLCVWSSKFLISGSVTYSLFLASLSKWLADIQMISILIFFKLICIGLFIYCLRAWMIFWDSHFYKSVRSRKWQMLINPNYANNKQNMFVRYHSTFGNYKFMKIVTIFIVIALSLLTTISQMSTTFWDGPALVQTLSRAFFILSPLVITIWLYCKSNPIDDDWYVLGELKYMIIIIVVTILVYVVSIATVVSLLIFNSPVQEKHILISCYILYGQFLVCQCLLFGTQHVLHRWVLEKLFKLLLIKRKKVTTSVTSSQSTLPPASTKINDVKSSTDTGCTRNDSENSKSKPLKTSPSLVGLPVNGKLALSQSTSERKTVSELSRSRSLSLSFTYSLSLSSDNGGSPQRSPRDSKPDRKAVRLADILANYEALDVFIAHLLEERSLELILSYIEFVQFQNYLVELFGSDIKLPEKDRRILPAETPKSSIVYKEDGIKKLTESMDDVLRCCRSIAWNLYTRYVMTGCEYEINIESDLHNNLTALFGNKEMWLRNKDYGAQQLFDVFIPCIREMVGLLVFSLHRLKRKKSHWQKINLVFDKSA